MTGVVRRVVGPFNRVEGDLEVTLEVSKGIVTEAWVNSPLYRGFEQILLGRAPLDAMTLVPRICGICSVAQSAAAARALADAFGIVPPRNGTLAGNLTLAVENLADHLTHFYLYFMPDFASAAYSAHPWHAAVVERFRAGRGSAADEFLPARATFLQMMGLLAGKWPHTLALQPGGSTRPLQGSEIIRLQRLLRQFQRFLETTCIGAPLEQLAAVRTRTDLDTLRSAGGDADLPCFLRLADELDLWRTGRAVDRFLAVGAYAENGTHLFPAGVWQDGLTTFDPKDITEDTAHAWYVATGRPEHPAESATMPHLDHVPGYTWCKAPRLGGKVVETGSLARQLVAGQAFLRDQVACYGGSVATRVLARWIEIAVVVQAMAGWLEGLEPGAPYCVPCDTAGDAVGVGLVEAARGSLGHWIRIRRGRIHGYQIVAPTTWNFSPRDAAGQPGALEAALVGLSVPAHGAIPPVIHHVVRSFDPCMVCTVH